MLNPSFILGIGHNTKSKNAVELLFAIFKQFQSQHLITHLIKVGAVLYRDEYFMQYGLSDDLAKVTDRLILNEREKLFTQLAGIYLMVVIHHAKQLLCYII